MDNKLKSKKKIYVLWCRKLAYLYFDIENIIFLILFIQAPIMCDFLIIPFKVG